MDLNLNSLNATLKRLKRYSPEVYEWDVLDPCLMNIARFDSVGIMNLLHCLPGNMKDKGVVFENLQKLLNPGGVLFGSTILGAGVSLNYMAKKLRDYCNSKGYMSNTEDNPQDLRQSLEQYFPHISLTIVGSIALFSARK